MKKFDVYLAGKMGGRLVSEVVSERRAARRACDFYGLTYFDPAEKEGLYERHGKKTDRIDGGVQLATMQEFVSMDEAGLDQCRAILVLTGDTPSDGTWWEMARAFYHLQIPIYMIAPGRNSGKVVGFSNVKASLAFVNLKDACSYIAHYLALKKPQQLPSAAQNRIIAAGQDLVAAIERASWGTIRHPTLHMENAIATWKEEITCHLPPLKHDV